MLALMAQIVFLLGAQTAFAALALPDDARLSAVRSGLEESMVRVSDAGLPTELVVSKVREGLAKGVEPARIDSAVEQLAESLEAAAKLVTTRRPEAALSVPLVRAVCDARMAGVKPSALEVLVSAETPEPTARRAVELVTDLSLRGYPTERATALARSVVDLEPAALDRVAAGLETIREDYAITHVEAIDALAKGLTSSISFQTALDRTIDDERRKGMGRHRENGRMRESPGKSAMTLGRLPKMRGMSAKKK